MGGVRRWLLVVGLILLAVGAPLALHRATYAHSKRLRVVCPGRVYRSGQMTEAGFIDAIQSLKIRTVLNLQDDYPDPDVERSWLNSDTVKESELCERLGVRYVYIAPNLIPRRDVPQRRPEGIDQFLALMDDPDTYPVLIHCKAGLHRTGCLVAVYRMEYEGYTPTQALREVLDHGFGRTAGTEANDYIRQYILSFRRGLRLPEAHAQK